MASSMILEFDARVNANDLGKTSREFSKLAVSFEKQVGSALSEALKSGLSPKHLSAFEKRAQKIQSVLMTSRSKEERVQAIAQEKRFLGEYRNIRKVTESRLKAMGELKKGMQSTFNESVKDFAQGLGGAISDAVSLNMAGISSMVEKIGEKTARAGAKVQAGQGTGFFSRLVLKRLGKMIKLLGKLTMKVGLAAGVVGLLIAAVKEVMDHGAKMNRAVMEGGAVFGDFASEGKDVYHTLKEMRSAFEDVGRNLEWMQTGEEQLKILGAWQAAGYTAKEMAKGLQTAEDRMKEFRKATETATTYATLLGMSTDEVAENMAGYMNELGMSLDGIREKFAEVYNVAQQSGFGTKRFFGMVLQATSGMAMYNVRLNETAGLLYQMSKMLGRKGAEQMMGEITGPAASSRKEAFTNAMKMGKGIARELIGFEARRTAGGLLGKMEKKGVSADTATAEMQRRGIKLDFTSADALVKGMSKLTSKQQVQTLGALKSMGMGDDLIRQFEKSFDLMRGANSSKLERIAEALAASGPQAQLVSKLYAVNKVVPKALSEMSYIEAMAYEEMQGVSMQQFNQLKSLDRHTRASHQELKGLQEQQEKMHLENRDFSKEDRKNQIEQFGAYINKHGDRITANDVKVLDMEGEQLDKYEDQNKISNKLLDYQLHQGAAKVTNMEEELDQQTRLAIDIRRHTQDTSKAIDVLKEAMLSDIYDAIMGIYYFLSGKDAKEEKYRKAAIEQVRERKREVEEDTRSLQKELTKIDVALEKTKDEGKKKGLMKKRGEIESAIRTQEFNTKRLGLLISEIMSVDSDIGGLKGLFTDLVGTTDDLRKGAAIFFEEAMTDVRKKMGAEDFIQSMPSIERENLRDLAESRVQKRVSEGKVGEVSDYLIQVEMRKLVGQRIAASEAIKERHGLRPGEEAGDLDYKVVAAFLETDAARSGDITMRQMRWAEDAANQVGMLREDMESAGVEDKKHLEKVMLDKQPEKFQKALREENERMQRDALVGRLAGLGASDAEGMASSLLSKGDYVPSKYRDFIKEHGGKILDMPGLSGAVASKIGRIKSMDDFIWRPGQAPIRISEKDVLTGAKAGGPISKGMSGGGKVINHFYNDARGFWANEKKRRRAFTGYV